MKNNIYKYSFQILIDGIYFNKSVYINYLFTIFTNNKYDLLIFKI